MCTVATFRLVRLLFSTAQPPPGVCVGCVCAACPRSARRRVGVSACVLVCWCVGGEIAPIPISQFFLEKVIIYRGPSPHNTRPTFTWYDGFFVGGFWSFFSFFLGYDVRACPATGPAKLDSGLKTRLAAAPKAEDTARPGRNRGARLARPPGPPGPPGPPAWPPPGPAWPRLKRSPVWPEFNSGYHTPPKPESDMARVYLWLPHPA